MKTINLRCWIYGCTMEHWALGQQECDRCGAYVDGAEFQPGWLWPLKSWLEWRIITPFRFWVSHKCEGADCDRRIWFSSERCCSEACDELWMPF